MLRSIEIPIAGKIRRNVRGDVGECPQFTEMRIHHY